MHTIVVSPLNDLMRDQLMKLVNMKVPSSMFPSADSLSDSDIDKIRRFKFRLIYGYPEAFLGEHSWVLDNNDLIRERMRLSRQLSLMRRIPT